MPAHKTAFEMYLDEVHVIVIVNPSTTDNINHAKSVLHWRRTSLWLSFIVPVLLYDLEIWSRWPKLNEPAKMKLYEVWKISLDSWNEVDSLETPILLNPFSARCSVLPLRPVQELCSMFSGLCTNFLQKPAIGQYSSHSLTFEHPNNIIKRDKHIKNAIHQWQFKEF